ncbi:universal stress protein [Halomontanus rarus]|uniref:universal stress protein n=1 Tax=Halomontanus rarus TaxID=3034020 RepID=UPI0023E84982|nr:universal stress protein [Halovivax sp. TS33]
MTDSTHRTVLVPIASDEDAAVTGDAVSSRFDEATIIAVYVVEKAGGAPDTAGVEQREEFARGLFETFERHFRDGNATIRNRIAYGTNVAKTLLEVAADEDADAIVFVPRGESRWRQLLTGDVARKLLNQTDRPVLILPRETDE